MLVTWYIREWVNLADHLPWAQATPCKRVCRFKSCLSDHFANEYQQHGYLTVYEVIKAGAAPVVRAILNR